MKKNLFLIGAFLLTLAISTTSNAQSILPCVTQLEEFFNVDIKKGPPQVLNGLGMRPQFGRIKNHTAASAHAHLKSVYKRSKRSAVEIDRLLHALGYDGINDLAFTEIMIMPDIVEAQTTGIMGSRGNKYSRATFGKDFEAFKIKSKNGPCFVYLMKSCGNIFHPPFPTCDTPHPCAECNNAVSWKGTVNPFCPCIPCPECQDTMDQTITLAGAGNINSGDRIQGERNVRLVASYEGQSVCMDELTVPINVSYEYSASGLTASNQVVTIDNQDNNALASVDLKIPVNLNFSVTGSQLSYGDNGAIRMNVTKKRFKKLKKYYDVCPSDLGISSTMEGLSAPEMDNMPASDVSEAGDGVKGLKKQTLYFSGNAAISEVVSKEHSHIITVIAHSKKTKKLGKGESADRYLCLGQYAVPGSSALLFNLTGSSNLTKAIEICDAEGNQPAVRNINLPIDLNAAFTSQELKAGDDGKVYIEITEKQYMKFAKRFSKCCSNGDNSCID